MDLSTTFVFYLLIGTGVAMATFLRGERNAPLRQAARCVLAVVFWPLFLPVLLSRPPSSQPLESPTDAPTAVAPDDLTQAIQRVEEELAAAIRGLDGWGEEMLALEEDRFAELRATWHAHAKRIRELDELLASPGFAAPTRCEADHAEADPDPDSPREEGAQRLRRSEQVRRENIERLRRLRRRMHDDLVGTLAWVRELVTMIHLAKFTGAPASRAEELVAQIAAAVEGLSEASSWAEEPLHA